MRYSLEALWVSGSSCKRRAWAADWLGIGGTSRSLTCNGLDPLGPQDMPLGGPLSQQATVEQIWAALPTALQLFADAPPDGCKLCHEGRPGRRHLLGPAGELINVWHLCDSHACVYGLTCCGTMGRLQGNICTDLERSAFEKLRAARA